MPLRTVAAADGGSHGCGPGMGSTLRAATISRSARSAAGGASTPSPCTLAHTTARGLRPSGEGVVLVATPVDRSRANFPVATAADRCTWKVPGGFSLSSRMR